MLTGPDLIYQDFNISDFQIGPIEWRKINYKSKFYKKSYKIPRTVKNVNILHILYTVLNIQPSTMLILIDFT